MSAPEPGRATAPTPDQAAFDAFWASPALGEEPAAPLERESPGIRAAWKAAASAVIVHTDFVLTDEVTGLRRQVDQGRAGLNAALARIAELEALLNAAKKRAEDTGRQLDRANITIAELRAGLAECPGGEHWLGQAGNFEQP